MFNILFYFLSSKFLCSNYFKIEAISIKRNADLLLNACKYTGLAVNREKTKYTEVGRHRGLMTNEHNWIGSNS